MVRVGFQVPGLLIAIIASLVLVTLVSANSELTGTLGAIAGMWFAVHQVPLSISGTSLGVVPLLPTIVLMVVVARSVYRVSTEVSTRRELGSIFAAAVLGPLLVTAVALAVATDASAAIGLSSPNAFHAFAWVAGVHATAAAIGVVTGSWDSLGLAPRVPIWVGEVVRPTMRAAMVLIAGGAAITLAAMVASWSTMEMLLDAGNGFVGFLGLTVLSILYLPNVVLGTSAVSVGSAAHVGEASVSLFHTAAGPLPPLPVLAVLPEGSAQTAWFLMLVVPITAAVMFGRDCARRTVDVHHAMSSVWLGAAVLGILAAVGGVAAGGNLGTFGTVEVTAWSFGLLAFAWLAVVGSLAAAVTAWRGGSKHDEPLPVKTERSSEQPVLTPRAQSADAQSADAQQPADAQSADVPPVVQEGHALDAEIIDVPEDVDVPTIAPEPDTTASAAVDVVEAEVVDLAVPPTSDVEEPVEGKSTEDLPVEPVDRSD
ncbi:hypothetical protein BJI47_03330 [Rhodococcus sp. 1168]|nr:hypothetical protein BJI47_03330 [Rhodococcus sp. 1168]